VTSALKEVAAAIMAKAPRPETVKTCLCPRESRRKPPGRPCSGPQARLESLTEVDSHHLKSETGERNGLEALIRS